MLLITYKLLIPAIPFPFEGIATATNLKTAINKVKFQAKCSGVKACRGNKVIEQEIINRKEI